MSLSDPRFNKLLFLCGILTVFLAITFSFAQAPSFNRDLENLRQATSTLTLAYEKIKVFEAWNSISNSTVSFNEVLKIGIIDSGIEVSHREFLSFPKVNINSVPVDAKLDTEAGGHGTQVAGIIGANNASATSSTNYVNWQMNGIVSGVNGLQYAIENRRDGGNEPSKYKVLREAASLAKLKVPVVNITFDITVKSFIFSSCEPVRTQANEIIFGALFRFYSDTLFVVSGGEIENGLSDIECFIPAALGNNLDNVIAVGGSTITDQRPSTIPFGGAVNIVAPSTGIYTPVPKGFGSFPNDLPISDRDYDNSFSGTSASAPMVTGVAGLIKSIKPLLTPPQIKQILIETADPIFATSTSSEAGKLLGSGCTAISIPAGQVQRGCRLNAEKAVCHPLVLNCQPVFPPAVCPLTGVLETSATITSQNTCVIHGLTIPAGITLRVEPGAVIKFVLTGELNVNGIFKAEGTASNPIFFTSIRDDTVGGDTNNDGSATTPQPQDWSVIRVQDGSADFIHSVVRYGGAGFFASGLSAENSLISIANSRFTKNFARNLVLSNSTTTITSSEIDNVGTGIRPTGGILTVNNTNFHDNGHPLFLSPQQNFIHSNNTAVNNSVNGIIMNGVMTSDRRWNNDNIPYVVFSGPATGTPATNTVVVSAGATLIIDPGSVVKFNFPSSAFIVQGKLNASGTQSQPIFFTSIKDDTIGGDTNNDGNSTSPQPEDWLAIEVFNGTANFNHSTIRYGGGQFSLIPTGLFAQSSIVSLLNSHLTRNFTRNFVSLFGTTTITSSEIDNSGTGFEQTIGNATITNSSIHDNTFLGARVFGPFPMNAVNNWWGSPNGPFHPTLNSSGTGNAVSDNVNFIPFLTTDPVGPLP